MLEAGRFPVEDAVSAIVPMEDAARILGEWSDAPGRFTKIMVRGLSIVLGLSMAVNDGSWSNECRFRRRQWKETDRGGKEHPVFPVGQMLPFVLVTVLFFLWGMSNNLTDILVQQFKKSFELSQFSAQLVQTANFLGYFCMAIPAALVMRRWGYKAGMVTGLLLFRRRHGAVLAGGGERRSM